MNTRRGYQRHHIIPYSSRNHSLFQRAGMDINSASNMKYLPVATGIDPNPNKSLHRGWNQTHANYNRIMETRLNRLESLAIRNNWDKTRIQKEIVALQTRTRNQLDTGQIKCH